MASHRDPTAARLVRQLRIDRGLSPETLSWAIFESTGERISGRAIRYIEHNGTVPTPRVQFAIASYFERLPSQVWGQSVPRLHARQGAAA